MVDGLKYYWMPSRYISISLLSTSRYKINNFYLKNYKEHTIYICDWFYQFNTLNYYLSAVVGTKFKFV